MTESRSQEKGKIISAMAGGKRMTILPLFCSFAQKNKQI